MNFFDKELHTKDYRLEAQSKCSNFSSNLAVIYLVYYAIVLTAGAIFNLPIFRITVDNFGGSVRMSMSWGTALAVFYTGHFLISIIAINKKIKDDINPEVNDLFVGFKKYGNVLGVYLLQTVYTFLWMMLFVIPGLVKKYSYSMALYIFDDNENMPINDCITESRKMMNGNKWKLFCLDLSYIGWYLLSALTLGILLLWVEPKHQYARYLFYLKVSGKVKEEIREN